MKRFLLLLISSCASYCCCAQEEIRFDSIPKIQEGVESSVLFIEKPLFFEPLFSTEGLEMFDQSMFNQPLLPDYSKRFDFKKYLGAAFATDYSFYSSGTYFSPYISSGKIFNQVAYRINNHFSYGGYSFGAQSVFDPPALNPGFQDMGIKGASIFMQYKVSDKFSIQTRVSISKRQSPWEP
jgi:hypothetical protein